MLTTAGQWPAPVLAGGSTTPDALIRETCRLFERYGIPVKPPRVSRMVRAYLAEVAPKGVAFHDFLAAQLALTVTERAGGNPRRVLTYADPTGDTAVRNVTRERQTSGGGR